MNSADLVRMARDRAGLTQRELADRSGIPRVTIARWENKRSEPSLASLRNVIAAAGLDLVVGLAEEDQSLGPLIADQLKLAPKGRLVRLLADDQLKGALGALDWIRKTKGAAIIIGPIAAALQGAPQRPGDGSVEVVAADQRPFYERLIEAGFKPSDDPERFAERDRRWSWRKESSTITLASALPGAKGYKDLRRGANAVKLGQGPPLWAASPRDLLRLAEASPRASEQARIPGLRALLGADQP